jgi:hypothetical protein
LPTETAGQLVTVQGRQPQLGQENVRPLREGGPERGSTVIGEKGFVAPVVQQKGKRVHGVMVAVRHQDAQRPALVW